MVRSITSKRGQVPQMKNCNVAHLEMMQNRLCKAFWKRGRPRFECVPGMKVCIHIEVPVSHQRHVHTHTPLYTHMLIIIYHHLVPCSGLFCACAVFQCLLHACVVFQFVFRMYTVTLNVFYACAVFKCVFHDMSCLSMCFSCLCSVLCVFDSCVAFHCAFHVCAVFNAYVEKFV